MHAAVDGQRGDTAAARLLHQQRQRPLKRQQRKRAAGIDANNPRRPVVNLRPGIRGDLTFTQGVNDSQQPPQAVGSAAIALPTGDVARYRRRVILVESISAQRPHRQRISFG